jgi:general secretion pathway protein L
VLEERLLDEAHDLHFALAPEAVAGEATWVAACNKAWLQTMLQAFESGGRRVNRVVPAHLPLAPDSPPIVHLVGSPESAWLVRCADDGVQTLPWTAGSHAAMGLGEGVVVCSEPALQPLAEQLSDSVQTVSRAEAMVLAARSAWDLAQFDLASTRGARLSKRSAQVWTFWAGAAGRPVRWALVALIVGNLAGLNAWAWQERSTLEAKRLEARSLLTKTFPKVSLVINAPLQIERELATLRQANGITSSHDLEPMLAAAAARGSTAAISPTAIEYVPGQLVLANMQLPAGDAEAPAATPEVALYKSRLEGSSWMLLAPGFAGPTAPAAAGVSP